MRQINRTTLFLIGGLLAICTSTQARERSTTPRYVIFMMADGMGVDELELGRQYSRHVLGRDLFITSVLAREGYVALQDTRSTSSEITDSAASASAWATGWKIKNGQISVHPETLEPLPTVLEYFKEQHGYRTGIVSNDAVTGASPSAWAAHVKNRGEAQEIARQFCDESQPDVILGGGRKDFLAKNRKDKRDLIRDFVSLHGYRYVSTAQELARVRSGKVLGLFNDSLLTLHIDRSPDGDQEPMTSEMIEAALGILSAGRPKGFFLFVEECVPDKAGHGNDAAATAQAVLELDRTAAAAYSFYKKHPGETLLVVTADHETGALQWLYGYDWAQKAAQGESRNGETSPVERLASVNASISKAAEGLGEKLTPEQRARLRWRYRHFQFDPEMETAMREGRSALGSLGEKDWKRVLTHLVSRNTGAYYTQGGHSQAAVPFFAIGVGAERFGSHTDNAEVGRQLFRLAGRQDFRMPTSAGAQ